METGRKVKSNISFYQHKSDSHKNGKFVYLRDRYGWAGEGRFWALNNLIADSDGCKLEIEPEYELAKIARELDMNSIEFTEFLDFLITKCKLVVREGSFIYTKRVQDVYNTLKGRSKVNQKHYLKSKSTDLKLEFKTSENEFKTSETMQLDSRVGSITKDVMKYFALSELNHFRQMAEITQFLNIISSKLDYFLIQFDYYKKQREASRIAKHNIKNFLGTVENKFEDGAWNAENWKDKYNEIIAKSQKLDPGATPQKGKVIKEAI
jgi:hypothetical protein